MTVIDGQKRLEIKAAFEKACAGWQDGRLVTCYNSDLIILYRLYLAQLPGGIIPDRVKVRARYYGRKNTTAAGKYRKTDGERIVEINPYPFVTMGRESGDAVIDGRNVKTPLEAMMAVFEHELTHLIEDVKYGSTGHSPRFKALGAELFGRDLKARSGHTMAAGAYRPVKAHSSEIKKGDKVSFVSEKYGELTGRVERIVRRATVRIEGGKYNRVKFYVPLHLLKKL